jgi:CRP/FNR family cyclic AMP-dependent transcriptional regulator
MSPLRDVTIFQDLPAAYLARLEAGGRLVEPHDGVELFTQGDPGDAVFAIVGGEGQVRVGVIDRRSKRLMAEVFRKGDIFGEISVIDGGERTAHATVQGRVRLWRIGHAAFLATLEECPALGAALCRMLALRLRRTFQLLQDATFETLEVRLARQLLRLAQLDGKRTEQGLRLAGRFRQADLADLMGATTRSIISILNAWRAEGVVIYQAERGQLTIRQEAALRALVGPGDDV